MFFLLIQQSEATAAQRRVHFQLVDATDGITAETGEGSGQPQVSKNGAAFANTSATLNFPTSLTTPPGSNPSTYFGAYP